MTTRIKPSEIARLRLVSQLLSGTGAAGAGAAGAAAVVRHMLALQAQDYPASRWAVGVRAPGCLEVDVVAALAQGSILRSWPMRGTLHLVPAEDFGWMLALTAPRTIAQMAGRHRQLDLDASVFEAARAIAVEALSGRRSLSREAFTALLDSRGVATTGQRGYHIIGFLAHAGALCWGPPQGKQQALVLLDEWVPAPRRLERDEALGEFLLRYMVGHGPATLEDFVWWSKLTVAEAKVGLAVARGRLVEIGGADGRRYWIAAGAEPDPASPAELRRFKRSLYLLPGYDEFFLGYRDRDVAIDAADVERIIPGKNGLFLPIIVAGGRIVGTWRRSVSARRVTVEPAPFADAGLGAGQRVGLERAAAGYGRFLGLPVGMAEPVMSGDSA